MTAILGERIPQNRQNIPQSSLLWRFGKYRATAAQKRRHRGRGSGSRSSSAPRLPEIAHAYVGRLVDVTPFTIGFYRPVSEHRIRPRLDVPIDTASEDDDSSLAAIWQAAERHS